VSEPVSPDGCLCYEEERRRALRFGLLPGQSCIKDRRMHTTAPWLLSS